MGIKRKTNTGELTKRRPKLRQKGDPKYHIIDGRTHVVKNTIVSLKPKRPNESGSGAIPTKGETFINPTHAPGNKKRMKKIGQLG